MWYARQQLHVAYQVMVCHMYLKQSKCCRILGLKHGLTILLLSSEAKPHDHYATEP